MPLLIDKLAEKIDYLRRPEVEGVISILLEVPGISSSELVQLTGIPKETLRDFKTAAAFLLKPTGKDAIYIREEYLEALKKENPSSYNWSLLELKDNELTEKLKRVRNDHKLLAKREYDQFFATAETSASKALILGKKGLLDGSKIALLGDDDLVSVSASLASKNNAKISVFEVDKELLVANKSINEGLGNNNIQYYLYDARSDLPSQHAGKFDVAVIDPPYTKEGVTLFLNRAIELLVDDKKHAKYIYLYFGTSFKTPEKIIKVQEIINQMGLVIEDRVDKFAHYNGAESIGSTSALYILQTTPFTHVLPLLAGYSSLYTYQTSKEEKFPYVDHVVAKIHDVPKAILGSKAALLKVIGEFCRTHKLNVVDQKVTKFKNGGLTVTFILSSSNLVVHTWPEHRAVHIDLVTCSPIYHKAGIGESLSKIFATKQLEIRVVE